MRTGPRVSKSAQIKQSLVNYDGPQLMLLETNRGHPMLAVAVEKGGMKFPMFGCETLENHLKRYLMGKVDLHFIFAASPIQRLYFYDLALAQEGVVKLSQATGPEAANEKFFPEPGIFSSSHTHPLDGQAVEDKGRQRFLIDGTWEARDFSRFYGKLADTYSLAYIADGLGSDIINEKDKSFLRNSIIEKNWQGGGSYFSFYEDMKERASLGHRLRVASIEYHSPGHIELAGNEKVLSTVISLIEGFIKDSDRIGEQYSTLYKVLQRGKLLRAEKTNAIKSPAMRKHIRSLANKLAKKAGLPNYPDVFIACEHNVLVYAKVVLSFCRRIRGLVQFYEEGRVKTGKILA